MDLPVAPAFQPRFLTDAQLREGIEYYHLGRGQSLSLTPGGRNHDGLCYAAKWLEAAHPGLKGAYKDLSAWLEVSR